MKTAEELLAELVAYVRPPKQCSIKLKEWPANQLTIRNWIAIRGYIEGVERERYDTKLAELRKSDPQVDWSNVSLREDSRRVIFYLDRDTAE